MRDIDAPPSNGANLIARRPVHGRANVVLAEMVGSPQPFVTWIEDEEGGLFWGHYYETLPEARADYDARVREAA